MAWKPVQQQPEPPRAMYAAGNVVVDGSGCPPAAKTYATWNPSDKGAAVTLMAGRLVSVTSASGMVRATIGKSSGKWYWEVATNTFATTTPGVGIATASASLTQYLGGNANGYAWFANEGKKYTGGVGTAYAGSWTTITDVIGVALDMDAGTITIYKNGVSLGTMFSGLTGTFYPAMSGNSASLSLCVANFGAQPFAYSVPAGFNEGVYL